MTGYLTTCPGTQVQLPELLRWNFKRTDGDPCDSFSVQFVFSAGQRKTLLQAVGFTAKEGRRTVFTGVVDDFEISLTGQGLLAEVTGRGMAALLLDSQVRAAEYQSAQLPDILNAYVKPWGITKIVADAMEPVREFVVETGYSCWQVLAGFCRHSSGIYPRFLADGTLILKKEVKGSMHTVDEGSGCTAVYDSRSRYGDVARQILVNTRNGQQTVAENAEFLAVGGKTVKVSGVTGSKIRASWRTASQRVEDAAKSSASLTLRLPGCFLAEPLDTVRVRLPMLGISGDYTVRAAESSGDDSGISCTLSLE